MIDFGDPVPLSVQVLDSTGVLANATAVTVTVTLPDLTTITPTVTNPTTGNYTATYTPTLSGRHGVRWVATGTNASAFTDAFSVDDPAPTGIVSLAEAKAHLNITSTTNDEELRRFIDAATNFIEFRIGPVVRRSIGPITVYPRGGLILLDGPIVSLTSIAVANGYANGYGYGFGFATFDLASVIVDNAAGIIRPSPYSGTFAFPVTVTYVGGRAVVPALIQQACLDYIAWCWERSQRGATSLPLPGGADEFAIMPTMTVPNAILQALEPYRFEAIA